MSDSSSLIYHKINKCKNVCGMMLGACCKHSLTTYTNISSTYFVFIWGKVWASGTFVGQQCLVIALQYELSAPVLASPYKNVQVFLNKFRNSTQLFPLNGR